MKVTIKKSKEGSYYLPLPDELIEEFNLETGDLFELLPDHNGIQIAYQNALINQIDPTILHNEIDFGGPDGNEEW